MLESAFVHLLISMLIHHSFCYAGETQAYIIEAHFTRVQVALENTE